MKSSALQPGVLYELDTWGKVGFILDKMTHYSNIERFHLDQPAAFMPNDSGKGTHVLALVRYAASTPEDDLKAAMIELSDYRRGRDLPKGWRVERVAPHSIQRSVAEARATNRAMVNAQAREEYVAGEKRKTAIALALHKLDIEAVALTLDHITLSHDDIVTLLGRVAR